MFGEFASLALAYELNSFERFKRNIKYYHKFALSVGNQ